MLVTPRRRTPSLTCDASSRACNPRRPALSCRVLCTQAGTSGPDTLLGTPRYDILCGREGNDVLEGAGGPDYLYADAGRDKVSARDGERDVISQAEAGAISRSWIRATARAPAASASLPASRGDGGVVPRRY